MSDSILPAAAIIATLLLKSPGGTPLDKTLYYGSNAASMADWLQTRHIANNPDEFHENNPLIGEHPSRSKVDNYFAGAWLLSQLLQRNTSEKFRRMYQAGSLGMELGMVKNNLGFGIKYDF